jgi:type I restriction enzyme M protein
MAERAWTREMRIYDFRTSQHFAMKTSAFSADDRSQRVESDPFRRFTYDELLSRDTVPSPDILIAEIQDEVAALMAQFAESRQASHAAMPGRRVS